MERVLLSVVGGRSGEVIREKKKLLDDKIIILSHLFFLQLFHPTLSSFTYISPPFSFPSSFRFLDRRGCPNIARLLRHHERLPVLPPRLRILDYTYLPFRLEHVPAGTKCPYQPPRSRTRRLASRRLKSRYSGNSSRLRFRVGTEVPGAEEPGGTATRVPVPPVQLVAMVGYYLIL